MEEPTPQTPAEILELGQAVHALREEIQKNKVDPAKVEKLNSFFDGYEERYNQPLVLAQQAAKNAEADVTELKALLETQGTNAGEAGNRIEALELEIATRGARESAENPTEYKNSDAYKALTQYAIHGYELLDIETKQLLRTDNDLEGGFLAPSELDTEIVKQVTEIDPLRSICRVRTIASKSMSVPIRTTLPVATYEGEADTGTDDVSNYASETLTPYRQTVTVPVTLDMLMDAAFDMESEIAQDASVAFAFGEGVNFVSGSDNKTPQGFTLNAVVIAGESTSGSSTEVLPVDIISMVGDLKAGYSAGGVYVLNRRVLAEIRAFRADSGESAGDRTGPFLWLPSVLDQGIAGIQGASLNGFPYILADSMADSTTALVPLAFGDFRRGYTIVDRTGLTMIRDELTLKKRGIIEFTFNRWNTGQVTLGEAITQLRLA